jgi:hypothetical protein
MQQRTLGDVVDALRHSRDVRKRGCSLLIGAGCSATAGVETAAGFVKLIEQRFKGAHERAAEKTYPKCMAELSRGQQRDLIIEQVWQAKINWAHMAIAQLIRKGYVDRVLTTNFDLLVLRACAMLGEFPAVYDFAISQLFRPGELPERAIFHLHGQSTGFVLMNTDDEVKTHSQRLGPLFQDAGQARPWIVVGYSGDNDPVFNHLAAVERFAISCSGWASRMKSRRRTSATSFSNPARMLFSSAATMPIAFLSSWRRSWNASRRTSCSARSAF